MLVAQIVLCMFLLASGLVSAAFWAACVVSGRLSDDNE